jgi:sulfane dehydrogenase subunit SoxC
VRRIELTEEPGMTFYEARTYAPILPGGKVYRFCFFQDVKSFITHPSPVLALNGPGFYEISGIAYSGNGRIARVMVSADGGTSWAQAELQQPVLSKAFTRFRVPWRWDGGPAVLQSRAWDEAGDAQPTRSQLVSARRNYASSGGDRLPQTTLQRHHQLVDRARRGGEACIRVTFPL